MSETHERTPPGRSQRRFRQEFNADAAASARDGDRPIASVPRDLGVGETNLENRVRHTRFERSDRPELTTAERADSMMLVLSTPPLGLATAIT